MTEHVRVGGKGQSGLFAIITDRKPSRFSAPRSLKKKSSVSGFICDISGDDGSPSRPGTSQPLETRLLHAVLCLGMSEVLAGFRLELLNQSSM